MADDGLTPEELAVLKEMANDGELLLDHARRQLERRMARGIFEGEVRTGDHASPWEARLFGLKNSLRSVNNAHNNSIAAYERAKEEMKRTAGDIHMVVELLRVFREELADEEPEQEAPDVT